MNKDKEMIMATNVKFVGVYVPINIHQKLRELAVQERTSLSGLLRSALFDKLEKNGLISAGMKKIER